MQQVLAPVRDAVGTIGNAVRLVNSVPMMAERAPRLAALDETFNRLEELSADARQVRVQHHWARLRRSATKAAPSDEPAPTVD
jgi:hypothetical protein